MLNMTRLGRQMRAVADNPDLAASSGINVAGAIRLAKELGPGKTIVTILADSGIRYQSKLFNPVFLRDKNLPVPKWMEC